MRCRPHQWPRQRSPAVTRLRPQLLKEPCRGFGDLADGVKSLTGKLHAQGSGAHRRSNEVHRLPVELARHAHVTNAAACDVAAERTAELVASRLEERLASRLAEALRPSVTDAVEKALGQLTLAANALPPQVGAQVASQVTGAISSSFKEHFAAVLVPSYERATAEMFEQMHGAFSAGLREFKSEVTAANAELVQHSVAKATSAHESMIAKATAASEKLVARMASGGGVTCVCRHRSGHGDYVHAQHGRLWHGLQISKRCGRKRRSDCKGSSSNNSSRDGRPCLTAAVAAAASVVGPLLAPNLTSTTTMSMSMMMMS